MKKPIPFGKYLLLERINVGGMAEVFKAKAFGVEGFERLVAVKRILPSIAEDREFIEMFIDEAKIAVQLTHANIGQIFDLGKVSDSYFIAMELVQGKDLRTIFDRSRKRGETLPVPMACYVVMKVCEGLDYAHNKKDSTGRDLNLVHRDVSPQNILISYDGEVKIIDFGIAKAAGKAGKTQAGILKGKFGYMSPEQVRGLPLDRRSDVFAVGIALYELLTGERLFQGESDFSTLEKVRNVEIMPPTTYNRKIPEELEHLVLKALAKDVDDRYQSAMDLHDDLQSFMYTSGNFFARKDLSAYMHKVFAEDIAKETARDEEYRRIRMDGTSGLEAFEHADPGTTVPEPGRRSAAAAPPAAPSPPGRAPSPPKRTMLGVGVPQAGPATAGPAPARKPPPPPPPRPGAASVPNLPPGGPGLDMDWEEEELATHVYDRPEGSDTERPPGGPDYPGASAPPLAALVAPALPGGAAPPIAPPPSRGATPTPAPQLPPLSAPLTPAPLGGTVPLGGVSYAPSVDLRSGSTEVVGFGGDYVHDRRRRSSWIIAVAAGVLGATLIATLGYVLFLAPPPTTTLHVTTEPADTAVYLDGQPVDGMRSPFVVTKVAPGEHRLEVRRADYRSWMQVLDVPAEGLTVPRIVLEPDVSTAAETGFSVESDPPSARVLANDREVGRTPLRATSLTPGRYTVRVEGSQRFVPWTGVVEVQAGTVTPLPRVTLTQRSALVRFESEPPGASVELVRGAERVAVPGVTPTVFDVEVAGGAWVVEMKRAGHQTFSDRLTVPAGTEEVQVRGTLVATAQASAAGSRGEGGVRTPRVGPRFGGAPGTAGGGPAPAVGGTGTLRLNSVPASEVFLDGSSIGNTPKMNVTVSAGRHTVRFVNPEFGLNQTVVLDVPAGQTVTHIARP